MPSYSMAAQEHRVEAALCYLPLRSWMLVRVDKCVGILPCRAVQAKTLVFFLFLPSCLLLLLPAFA